MVHGSLPSSLTQPLQVDTYNKFADDEDSPLGREHHQFDDIDTKSSLQLLSPESKYSPDLMLAPDSGCSSKEDTEEEVAPPQSQEVSESGEVHVFHDEQTETVAYLVGEGEEVEPDSQYIIVHDHIDGLNGEHVVTTVDEVQNQEQYMVVQMSEEGGIETQHQVCTVQEGDNLIQEASMDEPTGIVEVEVPYIHSQSLDYSIHEGIPPEETLMPDPCSEVDYPEPFCNSVLDKYVPEQDESVVVEKISYDTPVIIRSEVEPIVKINESDSDPEEGLHHVDHSIHSDTDIEDDLDMYSPMLSTNINHHDDVHVKFEKLKKKRKRKEPGSEFRKRHNLPHHVITENDGLYLDMNDGYQDQNIIAPNSTVIHNPRISSVPRKCSGISSIRVPRATENLTPIQKKHPNILRLLNLPPHYPPLPVVHYYPKGCSMLSDPPVITPPATPKRFMKNQAHVQELLLPAGTQSPTLVATSSLMTPPSPIENTTTFYAAEYPESAHDCDYQLESSGQVNTSSNTNDVAGLAPKPQHRLDDIVTKVKENTTTPAVQLVFPPQRKKSDTRMKKSQKRPVDVINIPTQSSDVHVQPPKQHNPPAETQKQTTAKRKRNPKRKPTVQPQPPKSSWKPTGHFQCLYCPYSSVTRNYLFRHWLVNHNTLKAYHCGYCKFSAYYHDVVTRHENTKHKDLPANVIVDIEIQERTFEDFANLFHITIHSSEKVKHTTSTGLMGMVELDPENYKNHEEEDAKPVTCYIPKQPDAAALENLAKAALKKKVSPQNGLSYPLSHPQPVSTSEVTGQAKHGADTTPRIELEQAQNTEKLRKVFKLPVDILDPQVVHQLASSLCGEGHAGNPLVSTSTTGIGADASRPPPETTSDNLSKVAGQNSYIQTGAGGFRSAVWFPKSNAMAPQAQKDDASILPSQIQDALNKLQHQQLRNLSKDSHDKKALSLLCDPDKSPYTQAQLTYAKEAAASLSRGPKILKVPSSAAIQKLTSPSKPTHTGIGSEAIKTPLFDRPPPLTLPFDTHPTALKPPLPVQPQLTSHSQHIAAFSEAYSTAVRRSMLDQPPPLTTEDMLAMSENDTTSFTPVYSAALKTPLLDQLTAFATAAGAAAGREAAKKEDINHTISLLDDPIMTPTSTVPLQNQQVSPPRLIHHSAVDSHLSQSKLPYAPTDGGDLIASLLKRPKMIPDDIASMHLKQLQNKSKPSGTSQAGITLQSKGLPTNIVQLGDTNLTNHFLPSSKS